jgi:O-succinylhomoserine sulfhydrylase
MEGATAGFACFWNGCVFNYGCIIKSGDHIVSSSSVLGNPFIVCELFPKVEYRNSYFDINNPDTIESCINLIQRFFCRITY